MPSKDSLEEILARHGELIRRALHPSLALRPDAEAPGHSRLGGNRMLARRSEPWSTYCGKPMALLAQVDFAEVQAGVEDIPQSGLLQALIATEDLPAMGESDLTNGAARLRLLSSDEDLIWIETQDVRPGAGVRFEIVQTASAYDIDGLSDDEQTAVAEAFRADGHRILGVPTEIQYNPFDYPEIYNPRDSRVLVLQIDCDQALGWHWVDRGVLHFLADGKAFSNGKIDDARFDMQFF